MTNSKKRQATAVWYFLGALVVLATAAFMWVALDAAAAAVFVPLLLGLVFLVAGTVVAIREAKSRPSST